MNTNVIEKITASVQQDFDRNVTHERTYKLAGAQETRLNLEEALAGTTSWERFVRRSNGLMNNQLGWRVVKGLRTLASSDPERFEGFVRAVWERDDLDAAEQLLSDAIGGSTDADAVKALRGAGTRAAIISFFRLVKDPTAHPIYRPSNVGDTIKAIYGRGIVAKDPIGILREYELRLDELLERFQAAGLPLQDRLDVQAVLYRAKALDVVEGAPIHSIAKGHREEDGNGGARILTELGEAAAPPSPMLVSATAADVAEHVVHVQAWLRSRGLYYADAVVCHLLVALLTKPFVVLSGLSGSGKTRLAIELGSCIGSVHVVPVKPDWTDTHGVLGYLNPLTGRYEITEALRAALSATASGAPVMLVLDEMNLAHVERYFADVLSAMESGHAIPLHRSDEVVREQGVPKELTWPRNLFVVGTVNADETTYPFSPKVLDRAFVIDVSDVDLDSYLTMTIGSSGDRPPLPAFTSRRDWRKLDIQASDGTFVRQLHDVLRDADRPFGYRTIDEALAFLTHARHFEDAGLLGRDALLASKILPRLHGRRHELERALDGLLDWLGVTPEAADDEDPVERSFPQTLKVLRRMHRQLEDEGHVASMIG